jgi:hypothetical protein
VVENIFFPAKTFDSGSTKWGRASQIDIHEEIALAAKKVALSNVFMRDGGLMLPGSGNIVLSHAA